MSCSYNPETPLKSSARRFRFSLKSALIAVAVVCLALGWKMARTNYGAELEAWDRRLRDVISANIASIPSGAARAGSADPVMGFEATDQLALLGAIQNHEVQNITPPADCLATSWNPVTTLDVTAHLKTENPTVVANRLVHHYESGLADHGLTRVSWLPDTCDPAESAPSAIWLSERPDHNAMVTIDVRVSAATGEADVRLRHIGRPRKLLW